MSEFVSESVSYAEMSQKTALFYKNIIRNAKLRKLTYLFSPVSNTHTHHTTTRTRTTTTTTTTSKPWSPD